MEPQVRGYMATKPASMMILYQTRLSAFMVFNDLFRNFWPVKPFYCGAVKAAALSSAWGRCSQCFPFKEMMPRGPGILSVRDA